MSKEIDKIYWEFVFVFANDSKKKNRINIVKRLRSAKLHFEQTISADEDEIFVRVGATETRLEVEAERISLPCLLRHSSEFTKHTYMPFRQAHKHKLRGDNHEDHALSFFRSSIRQQLMLSIIKGLPGEGGAGIDITTLKYKGKFLQFFALHEVEELQELDDEWAGLDHLLDYRHMFEQPIQKIRDYFGEYMAFYFAWLEYYTRALIPLSAMGIIAGYIQMGEGIDNPFVLVYSIFVSLWSTIFLEMWIRQQNRLAWYWGCTKSNDEEPTRPQYRGIERISPITNEKELYYDHSKRVCTYFISAPVIGVMLASVIIATFAILALRIISANTKGFESIGPTMAGMLNAVTIVVMDKIYLSVALWLNELGMMKTINRAHIYYLTVSITLLIINAFCMSLL
eukprot:TRINITY_DN9264_c0_g1_i1.p1 TRINITY_DN9264_c0_g1~~TRINITY_DN9264_c0_g1_i1.p1  ORF type:complete len:398 (+),score=59.93 TRINITY_DN9264_c0_g1_i1:56-1249(+)